MTLGPTTEEQLFDRFEAWEGRVERGWVVNFLGVRTRTEFFQTGEGARSRWVQTTAPPRDEEYPAWIDLLETVGEAQGLFTVAELGAGWGRWLANASAVARHVGLDFKLIGAEPEPTHFRWLQRHLADNGVPADAAVLYEAAVSPNPGWVRFEIGAPKAWYGQSITDAAPDQGPPGPLDRARATLASGAARGHKTTTVVPAITLDDVLETAARVDFLHVDIQGAEARVLASAPDTLARKVKRVHARTHSEEIEDRLRDLFGELGWRSRHDYACLQTHVTPYGEIPFQDGVQSWINPRL